MANVNNVNPVRLQPGHLHPTILPGVCNPANVVVEPAPEMDEPPRRIYLMRADPTGVVHQAYARLSERSARPLDHRADGWGFVCFAMICPRKGDGTLDNNGVPTFQVPRPEDAQYVAIKVINKRVLHAYLGYPLDAVPPFDDVIGLDNPYKDIFRMQQIGDNVHCLGCIEALEDEGFLYIVTPMAQTGTLPDAIFLGQPLVNENQAPQGDEDEALGRSPLTLPRIRALFQKILDILRYLQEQGICHHDLSPANFLFLEPDNLVAFGFGLSVKLPELVNGQRPPLLPAGNFGTFPFMAPEVFHNQVVFDGEAADLWSATMILYTMLTKQILYQLPHPNDICFRYFILAQALSSVPNNPAAVQVLIEIFDAEPPTEEERANLRAQGRTLLIKAVAHTGAFTPPIIELFENVLQVNPTLRWTLAEVRESSTFVIEGEGAVGGNQDI